MSTLPVTAKSFESLVKGEGILVLDFWAAWCGPCRAFAPVFEAASTRYPDIKWGKVDTDKEVELASAFRIRSIPTLMIFRDGILVFEQPGMVPAQVLDKLIASISALDMEDVRKKVAAQPQQAAD